MKGRATTGLIMALIVLFIIIGRCSAQSEQKSLPRGYIAFTKDFIFIRDKTDSVDYDLQIIKADTIFGSVAYTVISYNGIGQVLKTDHSLSYHFKSEAGRRSRTRIYIFNKTP